jgi:hypothetical protein
MGKVVIEPIKKSVWDYLFYFSMLVVTFWLILKIAGVIKTPFWLEYGVPIGSFIVGLLTFFQSLNRKFDDVNKRFEETLSIVGNILSNVARVESKLLHIGRDLERVKDALFAK